MAAPWEKYQADGPWTKFSASTPKTETSASQTFLENAGNQLSFGYLPQLQAMAQPVTDRIFNTITGNEVEAAPWDQMKGGGAEYVAARDNNLKRQERQNIDNPKAALAGSLAGGAVQAMAIPLPGVNPVTGGMLKKATLTGGKIAGISALQGAIQNPGDVEGQVDPLQLSERLTNAGKSAGIGLLTLGASKATGGLVKKLANSADDLKSTANSQALKASGFAKKHLKSMSREEQDVLGREALDKGLVKFGDTFDDVADKTIELQEKAGQELGDIYGKAKSVLSDQNLFDSLPPAKQERLLYSGYKPASDARALKEALAEELGDSPNASGALKKVSEYIDELASKYGDDIDIKKAQKIRRDLDGDINYARKMRDTPQIQKAYRYLRDHIQQKINDQADAVAEVVGGNLGKDLRRANKSYSQLAKIRDAVEDRLDAEQANRTIGLTDTIAGGAGAVTGGLIGALTGDSEEALQKGLLYSALSSVGGGLTNRIGRKYGNSTLAVGANKLADAAKYTTAPTGRLLQKMPVPNAGLLSRIATGQVMTPEFESAPVMDPTPVLMQAEQKKRNPDRRPNSIKKGQ